MGSSLKLFFLLFLTACSTPGTLTQSQVQNDTIAHTEPFDTLAAYRKKPGQVKNVNVRGYYRKDSTYVSGHKRSNRT